MVLCFDFRGNSSVQNRRFIGWIVWTWHLQTVGIIKTSFQRDVSFFLSQAGGRDDMYNAQVEELSDDKKQILCGSTSSFFHFFAWEGMFLLYLLLFFFFLKFVVDFFTDVSFSLFLCRVCKKLFAYFMWLLLEKERVCEWTVGWFLVFVVRKDYFLMMSTKKTSCWFDGIIWKDWG